MSNNRTVAGDVVAQYCRDFPHYPNRTLARLLTEKEPKLFGDLERTRTMVRAYRGNAGEHHRKRMGDKTLYRPNGDQSDSLESLPEPIKEAETWRVVPVDFKKALLLSDIHVPFHDKESLLLALRHGKKMGVDCIILNGDLCDFWSISFWERDPRLRVSLGDEVEMCKRVIEIIRDTFPKAQIILKQGNHEERLVRHIWSRAPQLATVMNAEGGEMITLSELLDAKNFGVSVVENRQPILAGPHLHILHGHEFGIRLDRSVNPARGLYARAVVNAIMGDCHQTSNHTGAGIGPAVSCWSVGCLCDLHPRYMPINKWTTGFATIELSGNAWSVENRKIINGNIV